MRCRPGDPIDLETVSSAETLQCPAAIGIWWRVLCGSHYSCRYCRHRHPCPFPGTGGRWSGGDKESVAAEPIGISLRTVESGKVLEDPALHRRLPYTANACRGLSSLQRLGRAGRSRDLPGTIKESRSLLNMTWGNRTPSLSLAEPPKTLWNYYRGFSGGCRTAIRGLLMGRAKELPYPQGAMILAQDYHPVFQREARRQTNTKLE